jgi:hypothetical protein
MKALLRKRHAAKTLSRDEIPVSQGLYVWSSANARDVLYVGKASNRGGLRGRIWSQHLNPRYLESRETKFIIPADDFQRGCKVLRNGKVCVDKSVFRRSIGRRFKLPPGEGTVRYIREHLSVAWVIFAPGLVREIPRLERELIRELKPSLNVAGIQLSTTSEGSRFHFPRSSSRGRSSTASRRHSSSPTPSKHASRRQRPLPRSKA